MDCLLPSYVCSSRHSPTSVPTAFLKRQNMRPPVDDTICSPPEILKKCIYLLGSLDPDMTLDSLTSEPAARD